MNQAQIRNFCIIAHIDHGKSTLADRMLELTGTVEKRKMKEQLLDQMDLERERGITIKLTPVRMDYTLHATPYTLNLIDTPGHADFGYEVSRSLAAVEGVVLLVDASQGVQAQTLTTLYQALEQNLEVIPVINKIDLPQADVEGASRELQELLGVPDEDILRVSGKTGAGVPELLQAIVERIPLPAGEPDQPVRALIFDSYYDAYRGVVVMVRMVDGSLRAKDQITLLGTKAEDALIEVGRFRPGMEPTETLAAGEIGYLVTGLRDVSEARVGDTITYSNISTFKNVNIKALPGYREPKPMVFAGLYPTDGAELAKLRDAFGKLKLNDAALVYEPTSSKAFGLGFRAGFLGLLHMEIVCERLNREFGVEVIVTTPSVAYQERLEGGKIVYAEPWVRLEIVVPQEFIGNMMDLAQLHRGLYQGTDYLGTTEQQRVVLRYHIPLAELITNFYNELKSRSSGYASMSYDFFEYREDDLVKLDIMVAEDEIDALSQVVHRSQAEARGRAITKRLKEVIPRQMFEVKLQAAVGSKVVARETLSAMRKDVTGYLYGGDITRKRKLLEKQKKGKKKMRQLGRVTVPSEVFIELLKQE